MRWIIGLAATVAVVGLAPAWAQTPGWTMQGDTRRNDAYGLVCPPKLVSYAFTSSFADKDGAGCAYSPVCPGGERACPGDPVGMLLASNNLGQVGWMWRQLWDGATLTHESIDGSGGPPFAGPALRFAVAPMEGKQTYFGAWQVSKHQTPIYAMVRYLPDQETQAGDFVRDGVKANP